MLHCTNDKEELSTLLISSNKIVSAITSTIFIPLFILIEPLLYLWLDLKDEETVYTAQILLVSMYVLVVFRSSMVQVLLMNGLHVQLMKIGLLEASSNIILSIILVKEYGMIGAAIGTLIPNVLLALFYNIPQSLKYSSTSVTNYFKKYLLHLSIAFSFSFIVASYLKDIILPNSMMNIMLNGFSISILFASLYFILTLKKEFKLFTSLNKGV